jgi:hypothetical protein
MSKLFRLFVASLLLIPSIGFAFPLVFSDENVAVMLHDKPCDVKEVFVQIEPAMRDQYKLASVVWNNQPLKACWTKVPEDLTPEPMYFILDETGDAGFIPQSSFKQDSGKVVPQGTRI